MLNLENEYSNMNINDRLLQIKKYFYHDEILI